MIKFIRYAFLMSLLLWPALSKPVSAQGVCQHLLPNGVYAGSSIADMDVTSFANGILLQEFTFHDVGQISLTIGCAITDGTYDFAVRRTLMYYPGAVPYVCAYNVAFSQPSGNVVVGVNGQPRIDVRWGHGVIEGSDCIDAGPADTSATWRFSLNGPPEVRTIGGNFRVQYDDPDGQDYDDLALMFASQGFDVTLAKGWTMTRQPEPKVKGLSSDLRQFFLAGIPVTNRYFSVIDWDDAGPGTADLILGNGLSMPMDVAGSIATVELPLGSVQGTGDIAISIEAKLGDRVDRLDGLGPLTLVPVPTWATPFKFQAQPPIGDHVLYKGEYRLPDKPLSANVSLPPQIPYVGGTWGLLPTQLKVGLSADSSGSRQSDAIGAQGGFSLGNRRFELAGNGNVYGTIRHDDLLFESDPLTLSTSGIFFQERLGLASVIPGAEQLFGVPGIGGLLRAFDGIAGITADVHGSMAGRGKLAVQGDRLGLTEGSFDAGLGVKAAAAARILTAFIELVGGGDGKLSMNIVPSPKVTKCEVLLYFQTTTGIFGFSTTLIDARHRFTGCTPASGQTELDETGLMLTSTPISIKMLYGRQQLAGSERMLTEAHTTNGLAETVLVENANPQAGPLLVGGPAGRLAFVWNSVGVSGAADVVSLRLFDGDGWGNPITVSQPGKPSFNPTTVFAKDGNILVVWNEAQTPPNLNALTEAFLRSFEIAWAEVNPSTGAILHRGQATADDILDFTPRLTAGKDGSVWLVWESSPGTSLTGSSTTPNHLKAARWIGSSWTNTESVSQNLVGVLFWEIAAVDGEHVWAATDQDTDGNLGTATDREIYIYKRTAGGWAIPFRLTNDAVLDSGPLLALTSDDQPVLAWQHGNSVMGLIGDPTNTQPQTWFDEDTGIGPMIGGGRLLVGAGGARTLMWVDGTDKGQDVWFARFNPTTQTWSSPAPLFRTPEQRSSLSARLLPDGDIMLGLAAAPVVNQTVAFEGGGTAEVPHVGDAVRLLVAQIPAGYTPPALDQTLFLPSIER